MLRSVIKKILNKPAINLCLFLGCMLFVGIFACHPIMLYGGESKLLEGIFEGYIEGKQEYPSVFSRKWELKDTDKLIVEAIHDEMDTYKDKWTEYVDIDVCEKQYLYKYSFSRANDDISGESHLLNIWGGNDYYEHIEAVDGNLNAPVIEENGISYIPCVISEITADNYKIFTGDRLTYKQINNGAGDSLHIYVSAVYRRKSLDDKYWLSSPDLEDAAFVKDDAFTMICNTFTSAGVIHCYEKILLNYTQIHPDNAGKYKDYIEQFFKLDSYFKTDMLSLLKTYQRQAVSAQMILWALELPCMILMIMFIIMVLSRIINSEESEVSVWRSRGFKKSQILRMYLYHILLIGIPAYFSGIAVGYGLCLVGASTDSFLVFAPKEISGYFISLKTFMYGGTAIVIVTILSELLVCKNTNKSITELKAVNKYKYRKRLSDKLFLEFVLLGVSIYLLVNFQKQKDGIIQGILNGDTQDPLIFIVPSMFILACGLVVYRIIRYVIDIIYHLFRHRMGAAAFAALTQVKRTYDTSRILSVFLAMTIAGGLFDASLATSINISIEKRTEYNVGASAKTTENWKKITHYESGNAEIKYVEPDYERYVRLEDGDVVVSQTRVIRDASVSIKYKKEAFNSGVYMGIITDEFGKTAFLNDDINEMHWYYALNALAAIPDGVIISDNYATKTGVSVGDNISYIRYRDKNDKEGKEASGTVVAIVKGFPGFEQYTYSENDAGGLTETENYLIVGNYAYAVSYFSPAPYEIWYNLSEGSSSDEIITALKESDIKIRNIILLDESLKAAKNDTIIQIINGIFTISFILCGIITIIGFLIYWIVSIKSRELLFGVYRAMGMHMSEISRLLFTEVMFGSMLPAVASLGIGVLTAYLYSALPVFVCIPQRSIIPLYYEPELNSIMNLGMGIVAVTILCLLIIGRFIRHMSIAQALKLGED